MFTFCHDNQVALTEISTFVGLNTHSLYFWNRDRKEIAVEPTFSLPSPDEPVVLEFKGDSSEAVSSTSQKEQSLAELKREIEEMEHGSQRSKGVGELHRKFSCLLSRREIDTLIKEERSRRNRSEKESCKRIKWRMPMTCLAFDDTWVYTKENGKKVYIHNIKDLASQYILPPMAGKMLTGEAVAENLEGLFVEYGAPLFLKRDNGGNLNSKEVNQLLDKFNVIPLNSPTYYSKYNGSVEQSNYWIKEQLKEVSQQTNCPINDDTILALARLAAHEENLKHRRVLDYSRAVETFWLGGRERAHLKKNGRLHLRELVMQRERTLLEKASKEKDGNHKLSESRKKKIKRKSVEEILKERGYIDVIEPKSVNQLIDKSVTEKSW